MFLRTTEFLWQEGHTAHLDEEDAMRETLQMLDVYAEVAREVAAIPVVEGEKTPGERFAGAVRTFSIEGMMRDGKALQAGTSHYLGTNFASAFGIQYLSQAGQQELCHTTSWGMSTRMIGGVIMTHGDDKGLVLPPAIAPHQVVIVPIGRGEAAEAVQAAVRDLARRLKAIGIRAHVDDRPQVSPGFKFNDWEMRGVPLRLEIGPRDIAAGTALLARRLGPEGKTAISLDTAPQTLAATLDGYQTFLLQRATEFRESRTATVTSWPEFAEVVAAGWARTLHCGRPSCEAEIKSETGATPRCIPSEAPAESGSCVRCNAPSAYGKRVLFGRAY
jgi:prolyl-tRNA synthetase